MQLKKNITPGKASIAFFIFYIFQLFIFIIYSQKLYANEKIVELIILDKVSSKTSNIEMKVGEELIFQNLLINVLKCQNSKFDDDPEITAYIQVKDINISDNEKVYVFNGWTFSSSPTLNPFDHPVYDLWLSSCKII